MDRELPRVSEQKILPSKCETRDTVVEAFIELAADAASESNTKIAGFPQAVLEISAALFPGVRPTVETEVDPETPDEPFLVVTVHATGRLNDIVRRQSEWHAKVEPHLGNLDVRLSVIPYECR